MKSPLNLLIGKVSSWVVMLLALAHALVTFGLLSLAENSTTPTSGLPDTAESQRVADLLAEFPTVEGTFAFVVYASESEFTDEQLVWLQGEFDQQTMMPSGGANEKFLEFTSGESNGEAFVPPAAISENGTTALITVPLEVADEFEVTRERIDSMRAIASQDVPAGLSAYVTGPEAFLKDVGSIFDGANFTLLGVTAIVVIVLLLITYRSPVLWIVPVLVILVADGMAGILARRVAEFFGFQADASVTGILSVLVFGAAANYALLLISRYREELLVNENRFDAMKQAYRGAAPAILASGSTVAISLSLLLLAEIESRQVLGLVSAVGILVAMVAGLLVLPAAMVLFGRWIFWPLIPKFGGKNPYEKSIWAKLGRGVAQRPLIVAALGVAILAGLASAGSGVKVGLSANDIFIQKPEAVTGQEVLAKGFAAGRAAPSILLVRDDFVADALAAVESVDGVDSVAPGASNDGRTRIDIVIDADPNSAEALTTVQNLRAALAALPAEAEPLIGGEDAIYLDTRDATERDQLLLVPLILGAVLLILILLLRSLAAPLMLLGAVVGSFFAAVGASWLIFQNVFGFPALDLTVLILAFLFLVALGVDYSIFLVTRAQEEAAKLGTREGMKKALGATGGVITSAGILLAAVFAVLGVLPLIALAQVGTIVCIGVLLDTLLVRTIIVPALAFMTGKRFWWPRKQFAD